MSANTTTIYLYPTEDQLLLPHLLVKLEVFPRSFEVTWQLHPSAGEYQVSREFLVFKTIYPLSALKDFFRVNGAIEDPRQITLTSKDASLLASHESYREIPKKMGAGSDASQRNNLSA